MGSFSRFRGFAIILVVIVAFVGVITALFHSFASTASTASPKTYTYQASNANIPNPERGFFNERVVYYNSNWSDKGGLSTSDLASIQQSGNRVVLVYYILQNFASTESPEQTCSQPYVADKPLPQDFLDGVNNDLSKIRNAGLKVILRFAYNFGSGLPDAPLCRILGHIAQLGPTLQQNVDVIDMLEAGFVGAWGEWHDSTNGLLTADTDGVDQINSASQLIVHELLKVLPQQRMLAMRYPRFTMELEGTTALTAQQAFSGTDLARVSAHNDCFLDRNDEGGTFQESSVASIQSQQTFLQQDNQYVPQVGETCAVASPNTDCSNALTELAQYHYSSLNEDFDKDVLSGWSNQNCLPQIQKDLGYRFRLTQSVIPATMAAGQTLNMSFDIANDGWANLYNPRTLELILVNQQKSSEYTLTLNDDPRTWLSGKTTTVKVSVTLPSTIASGTYNLYLNLSDLSPDLRTNPAYAIQLANTGVWDAQTGYNSLQATLQVTTGTATTSTATPTPTFSVITLPMPTLSVTATPIPTLPVRSTSIASSGKATPTPSSSTPATPTAPSSHPATPTATPASTPVTGKPAAPMANMTYEIVNSHSGLLMDVSSGSSSSGAAVVQNPASGAQSQQWKLVAASTSGSFVLMNLKSGLVLSVPGSSPQGGTPLDQENNKGGESQQWQLISVGDGNYTIVNLSSGQGIVASNTSTAGTALDNGSSNGQASQEWQLLLIS